MTDDYNEKFEAMTENMAIEQIYEQLAQRADLVSQIVLHAASIHALAVEVGLPPALADRMSLGFYEAEMTPVTVYQIGKGEL